MILQLRHTSFITQSLKEMYSGRETGLIDTGPLIIKIKFRFVSFDHHFTFSYLNKAKCDGKQNKTSLPADKKVFDFVNN